MKLQDLIDEVDLWILKVSGIEESLLSIISLAGNLSASTGDPAQRQKYKEMAASAREKLGKVEEYKHRLENILEELKLAKTQEDYRHIVAKKDKIKKEIEETRDWAEKLEKFLQEALSPNKAPATASRQRLR